ncbi:hypothetical protein I6N95_21485 [Vagococcus sp. BWB3-3]|uniref:Uncharacterized protein n=1 Tax=Vagococcus allomyrinae TaxID=2794353 RepID=A0A940SYP4_9ENTE|nr:hypothetical protein [Vagococcus allomyrinae]MBP1043603.1 hypothetical protein [Vagococcus allomyrinae]
MFSINYLIIYKEHFSTPKEETAFDSALSVICQQRIQLFPHTWLLTSSSFDSSDDLYFAIQQFDSVESRYLLVIEIKANYFGYLPQHQWQHINQALAN